MRCNISKRGNRVKIQVSLPPVASRIIRERNLRRGLAETLLLSGSLLGTWPRFASGSSRSRLCWTRLRVAEGSTLTVAEVGYRFSKMNSVINR